MLSPLSLPRGLTSLDQLEEAIQNDAVLSKHFKGFIIHPETILDPRGARIGGKQSFPIIPKSISPNSFFITHKDLHWGAIYRLNDETKEFDSYGRDMIPYIKDTYIPPKQRQGYLGASKDVGDCGYRTLDFLRKTFSHAK